jgi:hypothetical protein
MNITNFNQLNDANVNFFMDWLTRVKPDEAIILRREHKHQNETSLLAEWQTAAREGPDAEMSLQNEPVPILNDPLSSPFERGLNMDMGSEEVDAVNDFLSQE